MTGAFVQYVIENSSGLLKTPTLLEQHCLAKASLHIGGRLRQGGLNNGDWLLFAIAGKDVTGASSLQGGPFHHDPGL